MNNIVFATTIRSQKVTINGTDYMVGAIVVTGYSAEQEAPEFGFITKIITLPNKSYFQLKKYIAFQFNYHFHAFEVISGKEPRTFLTSTEWLFFHWHPHASSASILLVQREEMLLCMLWYHTAQLFMHKTLGYLNRQVSVIDN